MFIKIHERSGYSLIEVIIAMTVFAMISVPLIMLFGNSMKLTRSSEEQIEINAITRIIKENVSFAIKDTSAVHGNAAGSGELRTVSGLTESLHARNNLIILDHESDPAKNPYEEYRFDAVPLSSPGDDVHRFRISIKRKNGTILRVFIVEANKV